MSTKQIDRIILFADEEITRLHGINGRFLRRATEMLGNIHLLLYRYFKITEREDLHMEIANIEQELYDRILGSNRDLTCEEYFYYRKKTDVYWKIANIEHRRDCRRGQKN